LVSGYADFRYAESLAEFGEPRALPLSEGWLLERPVPGGGAHDLTGPYPLFACGNWAGLPADLEALENRAVSAVLVADPLGGADERDLERAFPDLMRPYKRHHVLDLHRQGRLPEHHRRHIRRAAAAVEVVVCGDPARQLDDWTRLYSSLVERHGLGGIRAFSRDAFARQLALPGLVAVRAERDGATVGMALWLEDAPTAHYHLAAYSPEGYEVSASYAIFDRALRHLRAQGVRWVDLGGSPDSGSAEGLERFKRGWASDERTAYLCGRVLDRGAYERLAAGRSGEWFPAYRAAEGNGDGR
jgi:GNAT acetyltransferase-like protein